ncbi:MAG TPA: phage holin family protein [Bacillales bacterium]|nr:phage holin family protein [Bacillales bacterium]
MIDVAKWFIHIVVNGVVLIVVAGYLDSFQIESLWAALVASMILALANLFIKPILIVLSIPFIAVTFGLFLIFINSLMLMLTAGLMGDAFDIEGIGTALLAAVVISVLNMLIERVIIKPLLEK